MLNEKLIIPPPVQPLNPTQFGMPGVVVISAFTPQRPLEGTEADDPVGVGPLGNPVYCDIEFTATSYQDRSGATVQLEALKLQTVLMVVDQQKKIITTPIDGADGEVVEYIGLGNYQLQINGVIDGQNGVHPKDEVAALLNICKAPKALNVVSWYLQQFDIDKIVITDFTFPQVPGGYSSQQFSIYAISNKMVETKIKETA